MKFTSVMIASVTCLFILCYFMLSTFIKSHIQVDLVVNKNLMKQIATMADIAQNKDVIPCIYENSLLHFKIKVIFLMYKSCQDYIRYLVMSLWMKSNEQARRIGVVALKITNPPTISVAEIITIFRYYGTPNRIPYNFSITYYLQENPISYL